MDNQNQPKWYFKTWPLVVSFLCVGPFMLPLVWTNPRFSKESKIIITAVVLVLTVLIYLLTAKSLKSLADYYQALAENY
jgi:hypothetical protein